MTYILKQESAFFYNTLSRRRIEASFCFDDLDVVEKWNSSIILLLLASDAS